MSELHEAGRFRARAVEGGWGKAASGTEQVAVLVKTELGKQLTWYGYLTEKAAERTMNSLITFGVSDLETLEGLSANEVDIVVEHDEYNGKVHAKIAWINALGSGGVALKDKVEGSERQAMLSKHKGNFLRLRKEAGAAAPTQPKLPLPGDNDDIPF